MSISAGQAAGCLFPSKELFPKSARLVRTNLLSIPIPGFFFGEDARVWAGIQIIYVGSFVLVTRGVGGLSIYIYMPVTLRKLVYFFLALFCKFCFFDNPTWSMYDVALASWPRLSLYGRFTPFVGWSYFSSGWWFTTNYICSVRIRHLTLFSWRVSFLSHQWTTNHFQVGNETPHPTWRENEKHRLRLVLLTKGICMDILVFRRIFLRSEVKRYRVCWAFRACARQEPLEELSEEAQGMLTGSNAQVFVEPQRYVGNMMDKMMWFSSVEGHYWLWSPSIFLFWSLLENFV